MSLVLVSPSIVIRLNEQSTLCFKLLAVSLVKLVDLRSTLPAKVQRPSSLVFAERSGVKTSAVLCLAKRMDLA